MTRRSNGQRDLGTDRDLARKGERAVHSRWRHMHRCLRPAGRAFAMPNRTARRDRVA